MYELHFSYFLYFCGTLNNNELKRIKRIARSDLAYFDFSLFTFHFSLAKPPPTENDTRKYICDCCKLTGFGGKERLIENNWPRLVGAMARLESGMNLTEEQIRQGFRLYRENSK